MTTAVMGFFRDHEEAHAAVHDLLKAGLTTGEIGLIAKDHSDKLLDLSGPSEELKSGTAKGMAAGGTAGALLGLAALAIPGIGPIIAAGPLAVALAGAGVGAATGGMLGALADMGVPENESRYYQEGVRRGGSLVVAKVTEATRSTAEAVLNRHGALNVQGEAENWRNEGWNPENPHSEAANYGDEGGSSQWGHSVLDAASKPSKALRDWEEGQAARPSPDNRQG